jgi:protein O-mannosyl-transferase
MISKCSDRCDRILLQVVVPILLVVACNLIYSQTLWFDFVNFDDDVYIYGNKSLLEGLTFSNVKNAFTSSHASLWHPLSTLSHLVDIELFGLSPGYFHATNLVIHCGVCVVLYFALTNLTNHGWSSALAAGLFACHPLRVESVAWISERKDILSGLFFATLLLTYAKYAKKPSSTGYLAVCCVSVGGFLSKPSFVTVPFLLILLDWWPLRRIALKKLSEGDSRPKLRFLWEKLPLIAGSIAVCLVTVNVQVNAIRNTGNFSFPLRLGNAICAYATYLGQTLWPSRLCCYYSYAQGGESWSKVFGSFLLLTIITGAAIAMRRRFPYLLVGWLWFLGMLVPNIGLIQAGTQAHADRFTYLPGIGLAVIMAGGAKSLSLWLPSATRWIGVVSVCMLVLLATLSWRQTQTWKNGVTLFGHAITITPKNAMLFNNFGNALISEGRTEEAEQSYRRAIELAPDQALGFINLGGILDFTGRSTEAIEKLRIAISLDEENDLAHHGLGLALLHAGNPQAAIESLKRANTIAPNNASILLDIGHYYSSIAEHTTAVEYFKNAIAIEPTSAKSHANLAIALFKLGRLDESISSFRKSLMHRPDHAETLKNAAWISVHSPNRSEQEKLDAIRWSERAVELTNSSEPIMLDVLAAAYARLGRFDDARKAANQALSLANSANRIDEAMQIRKHLDLYESGKALLD